jgi:hypothetical protein
MAEDIGDLEAEIVAMTGFRSISCSVCEWIEEREDAEHWDRILAGPVKRYGHTAIHTAMKKRQYGARSAKPIENHRREKHRVG